MPRTFDTKTPDLLVADGQIVMSASERPFFELLFKRLAPLQPSTILEVGFGLGISAQLIQDHLKPRTHDIVEIDPGIFADLRAFSRARPSVRGYHCDWYDFSRRSRYDLIFFDPYDYSEDFDPYPSVEDMLEYNRPIAEHASLLIKKSGLLCVPHFGEGEIEPMPGLRLVFLERLTVPRFQLYDGEYTNRAAIVCWANRPTVKEISSAARQVLDIRKRNPLHREGRAVVGYIAHHEYHYELTRVAHELSCTPRTLARAIRMIGDDIPTHVVAMVRQVLDSRLAASAQVLPKNSSA